MSDTLLYVGEACKAGKDVHVLAYQNKAKSSGPNAMVLPFPTSEPMSQDNVIDTSSFKNFLKDITNASKIHMRYLGTSRGFNSLAQVFDVGSYTIVLADNIKQIHDALDQVPEHKRPSISYNFLTGYSKLYKDQPIAVCCWDGAIEAEPLLWWYVPRDKSVLFIPTMDAHDGNAPKLEAIVDADHIVSVGSTLPDKTSRQRRVVYQDKIPASVRALLPSSSYGFKVYNRTKNGDMFVQTNKFNVGESHKDLPIIKRGRSFEDFDTQHPMYGWT